MKRKAAAVRNCILSAYIVYLNLLHTAAYADGGDAASLMQTIIEWISRLIVVPGVIFAVMGIIGYAQSHSEGDGPSQQKAIGKIAAAGMLLLLSFIIYASAGTLTTLIAH